MYRFLIVFIMSTSTFSMQAQDAPSKHTFSATRTTKLSPSQIWETWTDVANWSAWDSGLQSAKISQNWALEAKGILIPDKGPKVKFTVVQFQEGKSYTLKMPLPMGSFYLHRFLSETDGKTTFTHQIYFKGLTAGIFAKSMGKRYQEMLPEVLEALEKYVRDVTAVQD